MMKIKIYIAVSLITISITMFIYAWINFASILLICSALTGEVGLVFLLLAVTEKIFTQLKIKLIMSFILILLNIIFVSNLNSNYVFSSEKEVDNMARNLYTTATLIKMSHDRIKDRRFYTGINPYDKKHPIFPFISILLSSESKPELKIGSKNIVKVPTIGGDTINDYKKTINLILSNKVDEAGIFMLKETVALIHEGSLATILEIGENDLVRIFVNQEDLWTTCLILESYNPTSESDSEILKKFVDEADKKGLFYDSQRQFPYWANYSSQHTTRSDAIYALADQFDRNPGWVESHMGDSNNLFVIHHNLSAQWALERNEEMSSNSNIIDHKKE